MIEPELHHYEQVRDELRAGVLTHYKPENVTAPPAGEQFSMNWECLREGGCNTAACIGGWVYLRANPEATPREVIRWALRSLDKKELFYPGNGVVYSDVTPAQAADAIDNWLQHGEPRWVEVLA